MDKKKLKKYHLWVTEDLSPSSQLMLKIKKVFWDEYSKFQRIEIVDTFDFGKCLFLDGEIEFSTKDEFIYHETIVHSAMLAHPNPSKVLILGGGDGGCLREVLKYKNVRKAILVEIDKRIVELCRKFFPEVEQGALSDKRTRLVIEDGIKFLTRVKEKFDVIIMDLPDPELMKKGIESSLYNKNSLKKIYEKLSKEGVFISQACSPVFYRKKFNFMLRLAKKIFRKCTAITTYAPSYLFPWSFVLCVKGVGLDPEAMKVRFKKNKIKTRYYNPDMLNFLIELTKFLTRQNL